MRPSTTQHPGEARLLRSTLNNGVWSDAEFYGAAPLEPGPKEAYDVRGRRSTSGTCTIRLIYQRRKRPETAAEGLRYFSVADLFFSFGFVFLQTFNGAGDTLTPTVISLFSFWLVEVPVTFLLA